MLALAKVAGDEFLSRWGRAAASAERDNPLPYTMHIHTNFARQKFFSPSGVAQILMDAKEFLSATMLAQGI
jgi:hypothetical protein